MTRRVVRRVRGVLARPTIVGPDRLVLVAGLHRSGTTLVADLLASHPGAVGLRRRPFAPMGEGQHLQDVLPTGDDYGGPGDFGRALLAAEAGSLPRPGDADRILRQWGRHWERDPRGLVGIEKSPPSLLRLSWLEAAFPDAHFVVVVRHPAYSAMATLKWTSASLADAVDHWTLCHESAMRFLEDRPDTATLVTYQSLVDDPRATLFGLQERVGLAPCLDTPVAELLASVSDGNAAYDADLQAEVEADPAAEQAIRRALRSVPLWSDGPVAARTD